MKYNEKGEEIPDPTPVKITPRIRITPNKLWEFQRMMRTASYLAKTQGYETLEESEDFDCGDDDFDPKSPWEMQFDPTAGKEITKQEADFLQEQRNAFTAKFGKEQPWYRRVFKKRNTGKPVANKTPPAGNPGGGKPPAESGE